MKDSYYFTHDYNARTDPKMQQVLMDMGMEGIGMYWCVVEMLYEQGGFLNMKSLKSIAFGLHVEYDELMRLINDYGLFDNDGNEFWSDSILRRIGEREELSEKRRAAGIKGNIVRWGNKNKNDDNAEDMSQTDNTDITDLSQTDCKRIIAKSQTDNRKIANGLQGASQIIAIKGNKIKGNKIKESDNARACEDVLERFFREENQTNLEKLCMDYHTDMNTLKRTAQQIVNEWKLTEQSHTDYNDASKHFINLLRIKLNGRNNSNLKESDTREGRQNAAMRVIAEMQAEESSGNTYGNA